eukprot:scaffold4335_cov119-Cylindrotheca_fusiformis.AAC.11
MAKVGPAANLQIEFVEIVSLLVGWFAAKGTFAQNDMRHAAAMVVGVNVVRVAVLQNGAGCIDVVDQYGRDDDNDIVEDSIVAGWMFDSLTKIESMRSVLLCLLLLKEPFGDVSEPFSLFDNARIAT